MQTPPATDPFWQLSFQNLLTLASLLLAFWLAHRANVRRIEDVAKNTALELRELRTKVDLLYRVFERWLTKSLTSSGDD